MCLSVRTAVRTMVAEAERVEGQRSGRDKSRGPGDKSGRGL